jgi:ribosomal protein S4
MQNPKENQKLQYFRTRKRWIFQGHYAVKEYIKKVPFWVLKAHWVFRWDRLPSYKKNLIKKRLLFLQNKRVKIRKENMHVNEKISDYLTKTSKTAFGWSLWAIAKKVSRHRWKFYNSKKKKRGPKPKYVSASVRKLEEFIMKNIYLLNKRLWFKYNLLFSRYAYYRFGIANKNQLKMIGRFLKKKKGKLSKFVGFFESRLINILLRTAFHRVDWARWVILNGFVKVNNVIVKNINYIVAERSVISLNIHSMKRLRNLMYSFLMFNKWFRHGWKIKESEFWFIYKKILIDRRWSFSYLCQSHDFARIHLLSKPKISDLPSFSLGMDSSSFYNSLYRLI